MEEFNGYVVSGYRYVTEVCYGSKSSNSSCTDQYVYSGETVSSNDWLLNEDGAYGIIGLSPTSTLWQSFTEPVTRTAQYTVSIGRNTTNSSSVLDLGGSVSDTYESQDVMTITSNNDYTYDLESFQFGIIYTNPDSQYMKSLYTDFAVQFSISFLGLGLPAELYSQVKTYLEDITDDRIVCQNTVNGYCTLPTACSTYTLSDYYFVFNFTDSDGNYMRVPLETFFDEQNDGTCIVQITYMNYTDDSIVLGTMFFQEFYIGFINNYANPFNLYQQAQIYVGSNTIYSPYIGNTVLPDGPSPFSDDTTGLGIWVIVGICGGGFLLILLLLLLLLCCCCKKSSEE